VAPDPQRLQRLLDDFKVDELLSLVTLEEIADAWCRYQTRTHISGVEDEDPDWWAVELLLDSRFESDETRLRTVLELILERADEEAVFGVFAAGPLEDFVSDYDDDRLAWIEQRASSSPRFREALQRIWIWSLPPEVFARIERAAGAPLPVPEPGVELDVVPGDLPGTLQITRNGVVVDEIDGLDGEVNGLAALLKEADRAVAQQAAAAKRRVTPTFRSRS
jgi:uncharacterized protein DUF6869